MDFIVRADRILLFQKHFMISLGQDNISMGISYLTDSDSRRGNDFCPGIKLSLIVVNHNDHMMRLCQLNGLF